MQQQDAAVPHRRMPALKFCEMPIDLVALLDGKSPRPRLARNFRPLERDDLDISRARRGHAACDASSAVSDATD